MKKLIFTVISASLFILSGCGKESEETILTNARNKLEEGKKLESENRYDEAKKIYAEAVELYKKLIAEYPNSPSLPEIYSNIAKIYIDNLKEYPNAIKYYEELISKYPDTKEAKYGMFMIAFVYDEMLKDKDKAKEHYRKFLDKYPQDTDPNEKMSESARMMLQMLEENRTIEDIIRSSVINTRQDKKDDNTSQKDKNNTENKTIDKFSGESPEVPPVKNPDAQDTKQE